MNGHCSDLSNDTCTCVHPLPGDWVCVITLFHMHISHDLWEPAVPVSIGPHVLIFLILEVHQSSHPYPNADACQGWMKWLGLINNGYWGIVDCIVSGLQLQCQIQLLTCPLATASKWKCWWESDRFSLRRGASSQLLVGANSRFQSLISGTEHLGCEWQSWNYWTTSVQCL